MYNQKDIEEFAYLVTMTLLDKIVKPLGTEVCLKDNFISYDNPLLKDFCLSTGWVDDEYWTIERWYREDSLLEGFTERVSGIYPIKNLYLIGLNLDFISNLINRFHEDGYVFDITSSIEVKQVIAPQQLQYIESLEWDCDYWDSLPIEVIDSLDPEVRELCFEYYDSMLVSEALDPVEDTELESMFEFGIDAVMSYEQLDMLGVETLTSHEVDEMLNTVESITVKVEPVRDDVKLLPPVEVIEVITPQEVVEEPQEDIVSSTTTNEDLNMNTSTVWLDWSISPCLKAWELDLSTAKVVEPKYVPEVIPDFWKQDVETEVVVNDLIIKPVVQLYLPAGKEVVESNPVIQPVESKSEQLAEVEARVALACAKMARRSAYASPVRYGTINPTIHLTNPTTTPTTTNSEVVQVSDEQFAELEKMFDKAMAKPKHPFTVVNRKSFQGNQINPDCSRAKAIIGYGQVSEFKSTLFNVDEYDITRNVVVDVATTTPKSTPATPKAPKPSTATFASNFNSLVMAKYRELNGGIVRDSLVLNKLTSALRANNSEAYTALVTTFGNPTAVALHRKAYDAVVSAS